MEPIIYKEKFLSSWASLVAIFFIVISPFENIARIEQIYYVLGVAVLGLCLMARKTIKRNFTLIIPIYLVYAFFSSFWSINPSGLKDITTLLVVMLFLYLQLQFDYTDVDYEKIKKAFIVQGLIMVVLCSLFGSYMDGRFWLQSATSSADPNYLSGWFIIPICFIVEKLFDSSVKKMPKLVMIVEVFGFFYYIMQSGSRSGLITNSMALLFSILYTARSSVKKHPIRALLLIVMMIIVVVVGIQLMPATMLNRLLNSNSNLGGRGAIWKELWAAITNSVSGMIFGFGAGSVTYLNTYHMAAHNSFFDIWIQYGFVGLVLILSFLFIGFKRIYKRRPYTVIAFISMCVLIFTLSATSTRFVMFTFFLIGTNVICLERQT